MKSLKHLLLFTALTFMIFGSDVMAQRRGRDSQTRTTTTRSSRDATTYAQPQRSYSEHPRDRHYQHQQPQYQQPQRPRQQQPRYYAGNNRPQRVYYNNPNYHHDPYAYYYYGNDHLYHCESQRVVHLPSRARAVYFQGGTFYYAQGMFYQPVRRGFQVIVPPVGLYMDFLPRRARAFYAYNRQYFEHNGIFFKKARRRPGFVVVDCPW
ncbi:MAG: DUF6515 family protein [Bacteroidota bacterium]